MTKFAKGNTYGKGRPKGSRDAITKAVLDIVEDEITASLKDGNGLAELRRERPDVFWRFVGGLIPRELELGGAKSDVSFTMILHDPKSLGTKDSVIDLTPTGGTPVVPKPEVIEFNGSDNKDVEN